MPSLFSRHPLLSCNSLISLPYTIRGAHFSINTSDHVIPPFSNLIWLPATPRITLRLLSIAHRPFTIGSLLTSPVSPPTPSPSQPHVNFSVFPVQVMPFHTPPAPAFTCGHMLSFWWECHPLPYFWYDLVIMVYIAVFSIKLSNSEARGLSISTSSAPNTEPGSGKISKCFLNDFLRHTWETLPVWFQTTTTKRISQ